MTIEARASLARFPDLGKRSVRTTAPYVPARERHEPRTGEQRLRNTVSMPRRNRTAPVWRRHRLRWRGLLLLEVLATVSAGAVSAAAVLPDASPRRPRIVWDPIPFGPKRKAEMRAYVRRHYGSFMTPTWKLIHPRVIVIHFTDSPSFQSTYNTFAADVPDAELQELPGTCAHFVIDSDGSIHQIVSLGVMCRHTVGLNWTAIGVEHVGYSDTQVMGDQSQMSASLRLVRWLRCRFHIQIKNVIGHNESLSSPYHHEDVPALRSQTHDDFNHADMQVYRARARDAGRC
jgi:beta-N-acetylhexosaminidase